MTTASGTYPIAGTMHCLLCPDVHPDVDIINHIRLMHPDHYDPLDERHPVDDTEPETVTPETAPNTPG
jgi:hypothetical protein